MSKATSSLLAMTALDTTNLRLAITVPAHGKVLFKLACTITGATTLPAILLGVMNGATVLKRQVPQMFTGTQSAATQDATAKAEFVVTGLTPGALNADAAYGVQVLLAATNIKYGGPNDTTGNDAWGAFVFEAWDPQPLTAALDGAVNVKQWNGTNVAAPATAGIPDVNVKNMNNVAATSITAINANQGTTQPVNFTGTGASALAKSDMVDIAGAAVATGTAQIGVNAVNLGGTAQTGRDIGASVLLSTGTGAGQLDFTSGVVKANAVQLLGTAWLAPGTAGTPDVNAKLLGGTAQTGRDIGASVLLAGDFSATMKSSLNAATPASVTGAVGSVTGAVGSVTGAVGSVTGAVGSVTGNVSGSVASVVGLTASNLDATVSSRLSSASYTAPLSAATTRSAIGLAAANLDTQLAALDADIVSRLAAASYTAPDNASVAAIKLKTDSLNFTVAGKLDVNVLCINGVVVQGIGQASPNHWHG